MVKSHNPASSYRGKVMPTLTTKRIFPWFAFVLLCAAILGALSVAMVMPAKASVHTHHADTARSQGWNDSNTYLHNSPDTERN